MASRALKKRKHIRKHDIKSAVLTILLIFCGIFVAGGIGIYALCSSWLTDIPDYSNLQKLNQSATSKVYANDGETLLAEFQLENRTPVTLDQICDYVKQGTVATEDERFYEHNGFDIMGTGRALVNNLVGGSTQGGSTITMQLARNAVISDEMQEISYKRKVREIYIALKMEELYSKDDILQMYLNTINYGSGAYGIQAASERYFSKNATDLTLNEAATLIGIPQSPTYNNPIDNMENCVERRNVVLDRMASNGVITEEEAEATKAEEIVLNPSEPSNTGIYKYPYFTSYLRNQLTNYAEDYGLSNSDLFGSGLTIISTLDVEAQEDAAYACDLRSSQTGYTVTGVVVDPDNGYITAMYCPLDWDSSQINLITGEGTNGRTTGSSFKVFTLLAGIEAGISPDTQIDCGASMTVNGSTIRNFNGNNYGTRTIASALAVSSNTGFIRLCQSVGPDKVIEMARRLGITADLPEVPVVTLGVASIPSLQMAVAYSCIANGGTYYGPQCVQRIMDGDGNVLVDNSNPEGKRVLSAEVAYAATKAMETVVTSGTGTSTRLANGQVTAGKSGTSENYQDSWWIGFCPQFCAAFWMGEVTENYTDAASMNVDVEPTFKYFGDAYLADKSIEYFPEADDPAYIVNFADSTNHIGKWSGSSSSSNDDDDDDADENKETDGKKDDENTDNNGDNNGGDDTTPDPTPDPDPTPTPDPNPTPTPDPGTDSGGTT